MSSTKLTPFLCYFYSHRDKIVRFCLENEITPRRAKFQESLSAYKSSNHHQSVIFVVVLGRWASKIIAFQQVQFTCAGQIRCFKPIRIIRIVIESGYTLAWDIHWIYKKKIAISTLTYVDHFIFRGTYFWCVSTVRAFNLLFQDALKKIGNVTH